MLLRKPRSFAEVYNDLDGEIVNVFRILRDRGDELLRVIELTPFSRVDFEESYTPHPDPVEQARRTIYRSFAGFGSASVCGEISGFRAASQRYGTTPAHDWRNYTGAIPAIIDRLRGVVIENRDAISILERFDCPDALHYVDPPYVHSTRSTKTRGTDTGKGYRFEMSDEQHRDLARVLHGLRGAVVLSGYRCDLYDELYADWRRIDRAALADGARERVECLWLSPNAGLRQAALHLDEVRA